MSFTAQMKTLVDEVTSTRNDRSVAVARFKKETERILNDARECIKRTASNHREMARQLQIDLAGNRRGRLQRAQTLRDNVRGDLGKTRENLRHMLKDAKTRRQRRVMDLMQSFQQTRRLLSVDFHEASQVWQHPQRKLGAN